MGAKFVALATPTATVNTNGVACKTDDDCTNGKATYGVAKTALAAITVAADKENACCWYFEPVKAPSGTTAEIAAGDALQVVYKNYLGITTTIGEYNKYCTFDYPDTIADFKDTTKNTSYDSATGLVVGLKANGSINSKNYCDGGA